MPRKFLNEYQDGDLVDDVFLIAEKTLRANRNADLYLLSSLRDKSGAISGLQWNVTEEALSSINAGDYVNVRGKVQLYQGGLQMIIATIKPHEGTDLDPADFLPEANPNTASQLQAMRNLLDTVSNPHLAALIDAFWGDDDFIKRFSLAPAGVKAHHAYHGGLVEHVLNIMELADRVVDRFPGIDRDVLITGVFLHDIGKVDEMAYDTSFIYTDEGQLLGHLLIGCEMLTQKLGDVESAVGAPMPPELVWHLKHLILSHHGTIEFGAAKLPMTLEAIALHHLDALDAKIHEFQKVIEDDPNSDSPWTAFNPRLQRKIFKRQPLQIEAPAGS